MSDDNLFERLRDLSIGTGSRTPLAAIDRIEDALEQLSKLQYWLDMDQELFDRMTEEQQADHTYVQTAVDGIIGALKGEK
jgi:hypothetical protein